MSVLINENGADLFRVPVAAWSSIISRVREIFTGTVFTKLLSEIIPVYPELLAACHLFKETTFPGLIQEAVKLSAYAREAIADFSTLNAKVQSISGTTVPMDIQNQTIELLKALQERTSPLATSFSILETQLNDFISLNVQYGQEVHALVQRDNLPILPDIEQEIKTVQNALFRMNGTWMSLSNDLENVLRTPIDLTMSFMEALNIDAAIIEWKSIQEETAAFSSVVKEIEALELWEG